MGVRREEFIIYGFNVGMESYDDNKFEEYEEYFDKRGNIFYLIDGMSSEYFIVGKVLQHGDQYDGLELTEIDTSNSLNKFKMDREIRMHVKEKFNIEFTEKPKLYVLTHWS